MTAVQLVSLLASASGSPSLFQQLLTHSITGLGLAAIYAIASSGLVVTYTTSGIFNFAHGAFGMLAAFMYWQVHAPTEQGGWGLPTWLSVMLVVCVFAPLFGALIERVVMRGLRGTAEVVRIVVTIGLMLALLTIAPVIWPEDKARNVEKFFGESRIEIAGVGISYHRITILVVALLVALFLRLLLFETRLGTAMRAVVDDPALARLNGIRPDTVSMASWALGASLAALSGVLIASQSALNAVTLTLLVVNAFAAAVFGRLTSLPRAFAGAVVLGLAESLTVGFMKAGTGNALERAISEFEKTGWTVTALQPAMPAIVLFIVMWFTKDTRSRSHSLAVAREQFRVPRWSSAVAGGIALVVGTFMIGSLMGDRDLISLANGYLLALVVVSLVPLTGYSGQICLAQMTFFGVGAVTMSHVGPTNVVLGVVVSVALTAVVGTLVALPALRLKGIYLALLTAAFSTSFTYLIFKQQKLMANQQVQVPSLFHAVESPLGRLMQMAVVFALIGLVIVGIRRSSLGRRLIAMKDTPEACRTLGMNLVGSKVAAFAISAAIAGLAGAISGQIYQADSFAFENSLAITMLGVVGGIGSIGGAFFGGIMLGAFQSLFTTMFAVNRVGWFSVWSMSIIDLLKVGPGLMGMNLGKNPSGAAPQIAEGFEPIMQRRSAQLAMIVGIVVLWFAAFTDAIRNWSFVGALIVGLLGVAPILAHAFSGAAAAKKRAQLALGAGIAVVVGVAALNWETLIESNGMRVVAFIICGVGLGRVLMGLGGVTDPTRIVEPDANLIGLQQPLGRAAVLEVDRALDLIGEV